MMKDPMSIEKARAIGHTVAYGLKKFGAQFSPPISHPDLLEALAVMATSANWDAPSKEEVTKMNRQMAALNARYERLKQAKGFECAEPEPIRNLEANCG